MRFAAAGLALISLALAAGGADAAQTGRSAPPSLTLYDQPGFQGRSVTLYGDNLDLTDTGIVGRARSAQVFGQWRLCTAPRLRSGCRTLSQNIADLTALGIAGQVVSAALDMGYSRDSYAPDPFAYDVEDYSVPPPGYAPAPVYLPPVRQAAPLPPPVRRSPQAYPTPDYRGGPAFGPPSSFDPPPPYGGR